MTGHAQCALEIVADELTRHFSFDFLQIRKPGRFNQTRSPSKWIVNQVITNFGESSFCSSSNCPPVELRPPSRSNCETSNAVNEEISVNNLVRPVDHRHRQSKPTYVTSVYYRNQSESIKHLINFNENIVCVRFGFGKCDTATAISHRDSRLRNDVVAVNIR